MLKEHSIFICYRRDDGQDLANWIHKNLHGRSLKVDNGIEINMLIITTQLDIAGPSGLNWEKSYIENELNNAHSLCVICSPAALLNNLSSYDYFNYEIDWWIKNKKESTPILVSPKKYSRNYIPSKILNAWLNPQVSIFDENNIDFFIESVYRGINNQYLKSNSQLLSNKPINSNYKGIYYWEKDRHGRYILSSELYAKAAGYDSPLSMIGKTDFDMPWKTIAKYFQEGDRKIMMTNQNDRIHVLEKEIMVDRVADILVHENILRDHSGRAIGVTGYFIDVTGMKVFENSHNNNYDETGFNLGIEFNNEHLTSEEVLVFQCIVRNKSEIIIAKELNISILYVKSIIISLKQKLQCSNKNDIIINAIRSGLPLKLFGNI